MNAGLRGLIEDAPQCEAVEADLRRGLLKIAVPALMPIPRGAVVLLAVADVAAACQADDQAEEILFEPIGGEGVFRRIWASGVDFEFSRGGAEWTVYFERPGGDSRHPFTWWGSVHRQDVQGGTWGRTLPRMVMDDFGSLVPVDGGVL